MKQLIQTMILFLASFFRPAVTNASPGAGNQTIITNVFTYVGVAPQGVQKVALFDAATVGRMAHEISFAARTLFQNDNLTVQYSITVG